MPTSHINGNSELAESGKYSNNVLLAALQEMDAIIAESKLCLDNMPESTPARAVHNGHTPASCDQLSTAGLSLDKLSQSLEVLSGTNGRLVGMNGSVPGNISKFAGQLEATALSKSVPKINSYRVAPAQASVILQLADELKIQIQLACNDGRNEAKSLTKDTRRVLRNWLLEADDIKSRNRSINGGNDHLSDAVKRLEAERNSLQRQLQIVSERMTTQSDKIRQLQNLLIDKSCQLENTEALLREESLSRSALESRKVDLYGEVKDMRAKKLAAEKEMLALESRSPHIKETHLVQNGSDCDRLNGPVKSGSVNTAAHAHDITQDTLEKTVQLLSEKLDEKDRKIRQLESLLHRQNNYNDRSAVVTNGNGFTANSSNPVDSRDGGKPPHTSRLYPSTTIPNRRHNSAALAHANLAHSISVGSDDSLTKYADSLPASEGNGISSATNTGSRRRESSSSESDRLRCSTPKSGSSDERKQGTLRRFFEKFTRGSSSALNEEQPSPQTFKRGGIRATAGPRLQRTMNNAPKKWDASVPLSQWSHEQLVQWLEEEVQLPLTHAGKAWITNGEDLLKTNPVQLEKMLGLYHPLYKKKLILAIKALEENDTSPLNKLDYLWVLRWLDDVGLPQYKDVFAEARVDGRVLNYLTTDDLFLLKITNALHHASLKRGIQILRHCGFNPALIRRRPFKPDIPNESPDCVIYWSNHRVMEWLRALDLSEYGPNLRGSGVHGALMILEDRFNADILAELLSIPPSKTLLRRHLNKSFTELVGNQIMRHKRSASAASGYAPLSPHLKLKPTRRGFSLHRRRGKLEMDAQDYLCPPDLKVDLDAFVIDKETVRDENSPANGNVNKSLASSNSQLSVPSPTVLSLTI
ncbi:liprin-beta-2-like isoform X3 [Paramacrobiotus metropolitanus]|uniref:liprin-beta-2-like isoform X3 n=1 Tax=Paramacrobiotus metropolitanus TaxID=2943436 RepID=UPI002445A632|nr:liprin-beta-2-like isoform X3 [Paramacrobiotus metropolitanus]